MIVSLPEKDKKLVKPNGTKTQTDTSGDHVILDFVASLVAARAQTG